MRTKEFRPLFLAVEWHTVTSASTGKTLSQSCIANSTYEYRSTQQSGEWLRKTTATLIHLASPRSFSAVRDSRTSTIRVCVCVRAPADALKNKALLYYRGFISRLFNKWIHFSEYLRMKGKNRCLISADFCARFYFVTAVLKVLVPLGQWFPKGALWIPRVFATTSHGICGYIYVMAIL